jgi:hypothetical protein
MAHPPSISCNQHTALFHFILSAHSAHGGCRPIYPSVTMSQSRFLQEEYSKKIRQAANNAAINVATADLVAARNLCQDNGGKRLRMSSQSYKQVIASLQSVGVKITYDALKKRVLRASLEDRATAEIRLTNPSEQSESVVSSLSSSSLTSKDTDKTTADEH